MLWMRTNPKTLAVDMPVLSVAVSVAWTSVEPRFLSLGAGGRPAPVVRSSTVTGKSMPAAIMAGSVGGVI